jgi:hypothetical protein
MQYKSPRTVPYQRGKNAFVFLVCFHPTQQ